MLFVPIGMHLHVDAGHPVCGGLTVIYVYLLMTGLILWCMFNFARLSLGLLTHCFRSHRMLLLENLTLRQQLAVLSVGGPEQNPAPLTSVF